MYMEHCSGSKIGPLLKAEGFRSTQKSSIKINMDSQDFVKARGPYVTLFQTL